MAKADKKYHHGNLRQSLIDEALKRLDTDHPDLSLRELAKACGVSSNAPYRHFKTKDDLLGNLATHGFGLLYRRILDVRAEGSVKQFREVGQAFADFARDYAGLFQLMLGPSLQPSSALDVARTKCFEQLAESVRIVMGEVTATPEVKEKAVAAWSLFVGFAQASASRSFPLSLFTEPVAGSDVARTLARGLKD